MASPDGELSTLKLTGRTEDSLAEINGHRSVSKVNFQVGETSAVV